MSVNHVNLLDIKPAGPGQTELNYLSILIVLSVIIVGCLAFMFWQKHYFGNIKKQSDFIAVEVAKLNASVNATQKKALNKDILTKLNHPILWSNLLKELARSVPSSIQLSQVTGELKGKRGLVVIGSTHALPAIFLLKNKLSNLQECKKTHVIYLSESTFQIECQI